MSKQQKQWPRPTDDGVVIVPAFISGDTQYYQMADAFGMYSLRAMSAIDIYEQFQMRCSREFLLAWGTAFENVLNGQQIKTVELFDLWSKLKERIHFALPPEDMIWKLASVMYFDENESPYKYDPSYAERKIKTWKENGDIQDFFFKSPLTSLVPLPDFSEIDLRTYLKLVDKADSLTFEKVSSLLSSDQRKADFYRQLISAKSTEQTLSV